MVETQPGPTAPVDTGETRRLRRRRILSRPADQFRTSLVPTLGAAVLLLLLLSGIHQINAARTRDLAAANPASRDVLEAQAAALETTLASGSIFYMFGVLAIGLVHSQRLIGALFAMHRRIRRLAHGDLTSRLRLRRGDYFHDVAEALNAAAETFRKQAREDMADADDMIVILDRSPHASPLREGLRETLVRLRERKRRLLAAPEDEPAAPAEPLVEAVQV